MANVCTQCFADKELVGFISTQSKLGDCTFCGSKEAACIPIEELFDFFAELLSHFVPGNSSTSNTNTLKAIFQGQWNLFSSLESAYNILNHFLSNTSSSLPFSHADELADFSDEILENIGYWDLLKNQLTTQSRYFTDVNYLTDDLGWDGFFGSQSEIKQGQQLFRARVHHKSGESPYEAKDMYCPPAYLSTAGRANPSGIPYLYLSDNQETVLYEIRASYLDEISIGSFELKKDLVSPVIIADFTETNTIFHPQQVGAKIKATLLKQKISADLSKPMRRYDSELDYVPTQFICEFIKIYTGVQGIKFRSSLHTTGNNIVLFDQNLVNCQSIKQVKVRRVIISV